MKKPEDILAASIFAQECARIKETLEKRSDRSVSSQIFDIFLENYNEDDYEIPQTILTSSISLALKLLLDSKAPYNMILAIRTWGKLALEACMLGDDMYEGMEQAVMSN